MADEFDELPDGNLANANGPSDELSQLDAMIAADEAADAARKSPILKANGERGEDGRFKSATEGSRTAQRQTPTEISAANGRERGTQNAERGTDPKAAKAKADATQSGQTAEEQPKKDGDTSPQPSPQGGEGEDKKSRYEKAREREATAWQAINKAKDEQAARVAELDLREKTLAARESSLSQNRAQPAGEPKWQGYTAGQLAAAATNYEAGGDFEKADECRRIAGELEAQKAKANIHGNGNSGARQENWARLKTDLPELFNPANPLNKQMQELLQGDPKLLADEVGPYRAAMMVGRKAIARLEQESATHKAQAELVPGLQQKVSQLTARVQELEAATSIGDEGGSSMNRGSGGGAKAFHQMTTKQMEESLESEFAQALG